MTAATLLDFAPVLPLLRLLAFAVAFPVFAGPGAPRHVRLMVALALALIVCPLAPAGGTATIATLVAAPFEVMLGLALGYAFSLPFHALTVAGDLLGQEMGLNTAAQIDPVSGRPVPLLARLLEMLGLVLFVELGGFAILLRTLRASFELAPVGALVHPLALIETMVGNISASVSQGVGTALPVAALLLLLTLFAGLTARVLPRLHLFDFAWAVRLLVALVLIALLLPRVGPRLIDFTGDISRSLGAALGAR